MKVNKTVLYLLFGSIIGLSALVYAYISNEKPQPSPPLFLLQNNVNVMLEGKKPKLLTYKDIQLLSISKPFLIVGDDSLLFKTDTIQTTVYQIPTKPFVWKNYWSALIGESSQSDDTKRWNSAMIKLELFMNAEQESLSKQKGWKKLSEEEKFCHTLLATIEANPNCIFYIQNKEFQKGLNIERKQMQVDNLVLSKKTEIEKPSIYDQNIMFLPIILLLIGISGMIFTKRISNQEAFEEEKVVDDVEEEKPTLALPEELKHTHKAISENEKLVEKYFENFSKRYGDFFDMIETLPEYPTDEATKQQIKQQLVEMGLHAHSFARAYTFDRLNRPEKEPNLLLIQENKMVNELKPTDYKVFTKNPYETNKRYRFLRAILVEMNIGSLEGALLHDTYLPKEFLTNP